MSGNRRARRPQRRLRMVMTGGYRDGTAATASFWTSWPGVAEDRHPEQRAWRIMITEETGDLVPGGNQVLTVAVGPAWAARRRLPQERAEFYAACPPGAPAPARGRSS